MRCLMINLLCLLVNTKTRNSKNFLSCRNLCTRTEHAASAAQIEKSLRLTAPGTFEAGFPVSGESPARVKGATLELWRPIVTQPQRPHSERPHWGSLCSGR